MTLNLKRIAVLAAIAVTLLVVPGLASAGDPVLTNPSPDDDESITNRSATFSVGVNDSEFVPNTTNNYVDVRYYIGSSPLNQSDMQYTERLYANGTSTYTHNFTHGGVFDWYIEAEDTDGNVTRTPTRQIYVPATLRIENETSPGSLITNTTQITFYGDGQVYERSTSSGTLNLTGLPDTDYIVESSPDGTDYLDRSNYIFDPYRNKTLYHLRPNVTSIESRFLLRDQTGVFGTSTVVQIQRPITTSGMTVYETVSADRFGTEGFTTILEADQRYRVRLVSEDQTDIQVVGPYRSSLGEEVTVEPGDPSIQVGEFSEGFEASLTNITSVNDSTATFRVDYVDPTVSTDKLTIWLTSNERDGSSVKSPNSTYYNVGTVSETFNLFYRWTTGDVIAHFVIERNGETRKFTRAIYQPNYRGAPSSIDQGVLQIFGGLMLILTAGLFSQTNHEIGAVVLVGLAGVLWSLSLLGGMATGAGLMAAAFIAVLYKLGVRS